MSRIYRVSALAIVSVFALGVASAQQAPVTTHMVQNAQAPNIDTSNIVRAQFVKPGDVSPEEYQRLLSEADKIRAYQARQAQSTVAAQPVYQQPVPSQYYQVQYQQPQYAPQTQGQVTAPIVNGQVQGPYYQGQRYQPASGTQQVQAQPQPQIYVPTQVTPQTQPVQPSIPATYATPQISHAVVKGDTLYNISKRYGVPLSTLKQANSLTGNTISIGQGLVIPSVQKIIATPTRAIKQAPQTYPPQTYPAQPVYQPQNTAPTYQAQQPTYSQPTYTQPASSQPVYNYPTPLGIKPVNQPVYTYPAQSQVKPQAQPQPVYAYPTQTQAQGQIQPQTYKPVSYQGTYPGTLYYQPASTIQSNSTGTQPRVIRTVHPTQQSGIYAVLPKDTLYSISKIACVKADDIAKVNGITDAGGLQPGQRLTMPAGHCLR